MHDEENRFEIVKQTDKRGQFSLGYYHPVEIRDNNV
jgi:hypothetical protein